MTCIIMKKEFGTLTCTQGEQHVNMKAEISDAPTSRGTVKIVSTPPQFRGET